MEFEEKSVVNPGGCSTACAAASGYISPALVHSPSETSVSLLETFLPSEYTSLSGVCPHHGSVFLYVDVHTLRALAIRYIGAYGSGSTPGKSSHLPPIYLNFSGATVCRPTIMINYNAQIRKSRASENGDR